MIHAVTVCSTGTLAQPWAQRCARSWRRLGVAPVAALSDGSWTPADRDHALALGLAPVDPAEAEARVEGWLAARPHCREIRRRCVLFRKIVDVVATAPAACGRILFLDTDVLAAAPARLPADGPDVLYMLDDTSGYGGSWRAPLSRPMVVALNSGFLYYKPGLCDPDFLEWLVGRFLLQARRFWFFEQAAWALLAGRAGNHGKFDGRDVRLFSGYQKRTLEEIHAGRYKWFPRSRLTTDAAYVESVARGAKVIHFAGAGRSWFDRCADAAEDQPADAAPLPLRWEETRPARGAEPLLLAARMAISELGK